MPRYMVIETFRGGTSAPIYARFAAKGRMLPAGLKYLDSWLSANDDVCYQLMDAETPDSFDTWIAEWDDLVKFEVIELKQKPTGSQT